jgi:hypothetical protein
MPASFAPPRIGFPRSTWDYFRTYRLVSAYAAYLDRFPIATGGKAPYDLVARKRGDDPWSIVEKSPFHSKSPSQISEGRTDGANLFYRLFSTVTSGLPVIHPQSPLKLLTSQLPGNDPCVPLRRTGGAILTYELRAAIVDRIAPRSHK